MVEVEVREQHVGDIPWRDLEVGERAEQRRVLVVHSVDVLELVRALVPDSGVDEDGAAVSSKQQAPHRERDPVSVVGLDPPLPQGTRHDSEHGASIEAETPGLDEIDLVACEGHDGVDGWTVAVVKAGRLEVERDTLLKNWKPRKHANEPASSRARPSSVVVESGKPCGVTVAASQAAEVAGLLEPYQQRFEMVGERLNSV